MKLVVTGANGFVGRHVVAAARDRGHEVLALVRPSSPAGPIEDAVGVSIGRIDLRGGEGLVELLRGADGVIHLAAAKSGDFQAQFAGTVVATERLLDAMTRAGVERLVGVSSFSVYDYRRAEGSLIDEATPIDANPAGRDEYARTKLLQETLYRDHRSAGGGDSDRTVVIVRPGMIFGPDNLWHALIGAPMGGRFLRIGRSAIVPLTHVENVADALVLAAELNAPGAVLQEVPDVINIVDDDLPTQDGYVSLLRRLDPTSPPTVTVPWPIARGVAAGLAAANRRLLGGGAKFPGIVVPDRLDARFKPFTYSNDLAKVTLGWTPRWSIAEGIERSVAASSASSASRGLRTPSGSAGVRCPDPDAPTDRSGRD